MKLLLLAMGVIARQAALAVIRPNISEPQTTSGSFSIYQDEGFAPEFVLQIVGLGPEKPYNLAYTSKTLTRPFCSDPEFDFDADINKFDGFTTFTSNLKGQIYAKERIKTSTLFGSNSLIGKSILLTNAPEVGKETHNNTILACGTISLDATGGYGDYEGIQVFAPHGTH